MSFSARILWQTALRRTVRSISSAFQNLCWTTQQTLGTKYCRNISRSPLSTLCMLSREERGPSSSASLLWQTALRRAFRSISSAFQDLCWTTQQTFQTGYCRSLSRSPLSTFCMLSRDERYPLFSARLLWQVALRRAFRSIPSAFQDLCWATRPTLQTRHSIKFSRSLLSLFCVLSKDETCPLFSSRIF